MGSWSYGCGGGDESSVPMRDGIGKSRNLWDFDGNNHQEFVELDSQDLVRKALGNSSSSHGESLTSDSGGGGGVGRANAFLSSSSLLAVESNSRDSSSLIDLKLGGFLGPPKKMNRDNNGSLSSSSAQSSSPTKRMRAAAAPTGGVNSQSPPCCQVHGCRKDLSSSKDYHKRHRVCEVHSKTAKVTVNGIEQRFCQQCSRFHLLAEFDDGKRSCRKRLAGHNERRRKPHSARGGRLFQTFAGTRFQGATFSTSSVVHQDVLPEDVMHPQRYEMNVWHGNVKVEEGTDSSPQLSSIPMPNRHIPPPKSLYDGGISDITRCRISESNSNSNSNNACTGGPMYHHINTSLQRSMNGFNLSSSSNLHQSMSRSGRAPSLLSPMSRAPSSSAENHHHYDIARVSEKLTSAMSNATNDVQQGMNSRNNPVGSHESRVWEGMNSCENDNNNSNAPLQQMMLFSDNRPSYSVDHVVRGSDNRGRDGPTADLLELTSQLQRADHGDDERQRKQESGPFSGFRMTSMVERAIDEWA
ncbi:hypothetical protein DM860_010011 [Cuscuta australis]|uniref:SBP-type domain-containing protein n=1 Tax=Cuscuta australis TaxID=267555 RepID=A0A328D5Y4_9ASTE|nr:hypothetical protein DM860_010011 [Cuscuta australis]